MANPHPLVERVQAQLKQLGLNANVVSPPTTKPRFPADGWLRIFDGGAPVDYVVEAKARLTPASLGAAMMQLQHAATAAGHPALLVTEHITPPMAETLRGQKQQFADAAGNAYLEAPGLRVMVIGRKPPAAHANTNTSAGKAYTTSGLKVMFALLCDPALANATQRAIAAGAGVALGSIPAVLADLQQAGHMAELKQGRRLAANKRLLDEWSLTYARRLRAKTLRMTYEVKDFDTWQQWTIEAPAALWGGEPAAQLLVQYLRPGVLTLYAEKIPPRLLVAQRMIKVSQSVEGPRVLEWRKPFWGQLPAAPRPDTVHPVLVYADLLATGDARCIETARIVYDTHLARLLPAA
jgi:hypothetical protein